MKRFEVEIENCKNENTISEVKNKVIKAIEKCKKILKYDHEIFLLYDGVLWSAIMLRECWGGGLTIKHSYKIVKGVWENPQCTCVDKVEVIDLVKRLKTSQDKTSIACDALGVNY